MQQLSDSSTDYELLQLAWEVWHQPLQGARGCWTVGQACGRPDSPAALPVCTL